MKRPIIALAAAAALALASSAQAADLVVIASNGVKAALEELAPHYEQASGKVELGALLVNEIMAQPGVEIAGPLPAELQIYTPFSSGVSAAAKNAAGAKALAAFLTRAQSRAVFKAKGQEPIAPGL